MSLDPRAKDSIRETAGYLAALKMEVDRIKADTEIIKDIVRDIKKSVVRKYGKDES